MSITNQTPNTVFLGGDVNPVVINDLPASAAITPGHLIERFTNSGAVNVRKHSSSGGAAAKLVALDASMLNHGVDDAYAANDLVEAMVARPGTKMWMLIGSGENLAVGDFLSSAGDGTIKKESSSGVRLFQALEAINNSAGPSAARIRVEAL